MDKALGKFIVFDGGEGAGKGTVLKGLQDVVPPGTDFTREPGGTPFAERIRAELLSEEGGRMDPRTQFDFFWAARSDHLQYRILPNLLASKSVICDRFDSSTYAYQICGHEHRSLRHLFWETRAEHLKYVPTPFYIYLDVDPEEGMRRALSRGDDNHFDNQKLAFHTRVREGFRDFFFASSSSHSPQARQWDPPVDGCFIDANRSIEKVMAEVIKVVRNLLA